MAQKTFRERISRLRKVAQVGFIGGGTLVGAANADDGLQGAKVGGGLSTSAVVALAAADAALKSRPVKAIALATIAGATVGATAAPEGEILESAKTGAKWGVGAGLAATMLPSRREHEQNAQSYDESQYQERERIRRESQNNPDIAPHRTDRFL